MMMHRFNPLPLLSILLLCSPSAAQRPAPANPQATAATQNVLNFLWQLQDNSQVMLGQDLGHGNNIVSGYQNYVVNLSDQIGHFIGFIGGDYGLDSNHNPDLTNEVFVNHANAGGIVTLSWHLDNPWTGGSSWDTSQAGDLWELINSNCNSACQAWQQQKQMMANALRPLRDAGVPVLWRPLHEMNGDWFWWGRKSWDGHEEAYKALYRDLFNHLTYNEGMNNLLWVYSVANTWEDLLTRYYPGSAYVDVVGIDIYGDDVSTYFPQRDYVAMRSVGYHPVGLTEFGPTLATANGQYDYRILLDQMATLWPEFCFSLSWSNWQENGREVKISYSTNQFAAETFSRSNVVTIDEIDLTGGSPPPPPPVPQTTPSPPPPPPPPTPQPPAPGPNPSPPSATANPQASDSARGVLAYLFELQNSNKVLLGQDLGHGGTMLSGYDKYVVDLQSQTGKLIGFLGGDYGLDVNHNVADTNQILINHSNAGGIVTISWTMDNPWTEGTAWDTTRQENLWELIDYNSCNAACQRWQDQKVAAAAALRPLRDANVPVLWRPLHEMNGDWFWWGQKAGVQGHEDAFIAVWRDMFEFFTAREDLHNLLWVYSTANTFDPLLSRYYPGSSYVDVVGIDVYSDTAETWFTERDYKDLKSLGNHPMGLTEFGPTLSSAHGQYDYRDLLNDMATHWADFAFSYSWHNWVENDYEIMVAYATNPLGIAEVFTSSDVITLDEMNIPYLIPSPPAPNPPPPNPPPPNPPAPNPPAPNPPAPAPVPPTEDPSPREFRLKNRWQETYLNLSNNVNGAAVVLTERNDNWWSQRWYIEVVGDAANPSHVRLRCKWEDFYLNNSGDTNNANVVGWPLSSEDSINWWSMRWEIQGVEGTAPDMILKFINMWGNRCLGAGQDEAGNWNQVDTYDCNSEWWSQQWVVEYI